MRYKIDCLRCVCVVVFLNKENKPGNTTVVELSATDSDFGIFGQLTYHLGEESLYFEVNIIKAYTG